jgi:S-adenosylmethionine hydrolase
MVIVTPTSDSGSADVYAAATKDVIQTLAQAAPFLPSYVAVADPGVGGP